MDARRVIRNLEVLSWISVCVAIVVIGFVVFLRWHIFTLNRELAERHAQTQQAQGELNQLRRASGYGGFIHEFKNYVLRRDQAYYDRAVTDLDEIAISLTRLRTDPLLIERKRAIEAINNTFTEYQQKLMWASSIDEKATPAHLLDSLVRVDDRLALEGFQELEDGLTAITNGTATRTKSDLLFLLRLSGFALLLVPLLAGFWLVFRRSIKVVKDTVVLQEEAKNLAENASRSKSIFLANASHEIRTPLNAVLGMAQLLGNTELNGEQQRFIRMIDSSGKTLLTVINDILDISKIEAGKLDLTICQFDLGEVIHAVGTIMSVNVPNNDIELLIDVDPQIPRFLMGDSLRLQQILTNLTANALKFTHSGSVRLRVTIERQFDQELRLRFDVIDTGTGITSDQMQRLFQPFSQLEHSAGGTGLGLSICRKLVELMGGAIGVSSEPNKGSQFWFSLPFQMVANQAANDWIARPLYVLLVDDNDDACEVLRALGETLGWSVHVTQNAANAFQTLQSAHDKKHFDLALIDWRLSDSSGLELCAKIRTDAGFASLPLVVMVTASARNEILSDPLCDKIDAILSKPATLSNLNDAATEALSNRGKTHTHLSVSESQVAFPELANAHVLVVDDNRINQEIARRFLERYESKVDVASNGLEAVAALKARPNKYSLILMDIQMPQMDGYTASQILRTQLNITVPIIAMTAGVMAQEIERCKRSGMNDVISKPFELTHFLSTVKKYLELAQ